MGFKVTTDALLVQCTIWPRILSLTLFSANPWASQVALVVKNTPVNAADMRLRFDPWVGKISWRRAWQPSPVFLPGESHGQRSQEGDSPWCHKELDMIKVTACTHTLESEEHISFSLRFFNVIYSFIVPSPEGERVQDPSESHTPAAFHVLHVSASHFRQPGQCYLVPLVFIVHSRDFPGG